MQKPTKPCSTCGSNNWWLTSDGWYLCEKCHPNSGSSSESPPVPDEGYSPEVLALRDRVRQGNDVLFKAWLQIKEISDKEEQTYQDERWRKAKDKLSNLCSELQTKDYKDCLFLNGNGKKTKLCPQSADTYFCWVCPSIRKYWNEESQK